MPNKIPELKITCIHAGSVPGDGGTAPIVHLAEGESTIVALVGALRPGDVARIFVHGFEPDYGIRGPFALGEISSVHISTVHGATYVFELAA